MLAPSNDPAPGRLFIFGFGYSAGWLADLLRPQGWRVAGTTRTPEKAARMRAAGVEPFLFGPDQPLADVAAALGGATHILSSVPPEVGSGDPVLAAHGADIARIAGLRWAGYLSTTGVYGDTGGDWVDETSPLKARGERGLRRVTAEAEWLSLWRDHGVPVQIYRLPGIYGPGRSAIDALRSGTARRVDKPGHLFGRIHVADIAGALALSMAKPEPGTVLNIVDDEPASGADVVEYAARLLGVEPPPLIPFTPGALSPMAASFYADNRKVRNDRLVRHLGYRLLYPTYREGLAAQLAGEGGSP
ncbi:MULTISPECIES: SDR family oxidoreductase [unclassified Azospirillum]|uniref:SDR family oxidoreductase n=1 Tax=unclassified Azospirillum TaxID=2630922 RepID=UPI000B6E9DB1|nr:MULTISPECIES: SDR family oxidoreductase [unclassified Azospirillum]SNT06783.1 Nucleoside-diphosphate-sugar epimerase [Azospirillum sp. RU38E]SNT21726.1 Nucleoside-diphosphate-sugar epimerase [Azospirillum sp. RU37A]